MKLPLLCLCLGVLLAIKAPAQPAPLPPAEMQVLDFWVGEWEVFLATGQKEGGRRIEKQLGDLALQENWRKLDGHEGKSWFNCCRPKKRWKQVWVTDAGFTKEKVTTDAFPAGACDFAAGSRCATVQDSRPDDTHADPEWVGASGHRDLKRRRPDPVG